MSDGYALLKTTTIAWLLERIRAAGVVEFPGDVADDLGRHLPRIRVEVPGSIESGPVLTLEQHVKLLEDSSLDLPRDRQAGAFWKLVSAVTYEMLRNEALAREQLTMENKDE